MEEGGKKVLSSIILKKIDTVGRAVREDFSEEKGEGVSAFSENMVK